MRLFTLAVLSLLFNLLYALPLDAQSTETRLINQMGRGHVQSVEWYPGGDYILVNTVRGTWLYTWSMQDVAHLPNTFLATFDPNGQYIAGVDERGRVVLWSVDTLEVSRIVTEPSSHVWDIAWSPDGRYLAVASAANLGELYVIDMMNPGNGIRTRNAGEQLLWSPTGTYLANYTRGGGGSIWQFGEAAGYALQFSLAADASVYWRDERTLLTYEVADTYYRVTAWDAVTGESFDEGGSTLASDFYSADGTLQVSPAWDFVSVFNLNRPDRSFDTPRFLSSEDEAQVSIVQWSHGQQHVALGSNSSFRSIPAHLVVVDVHEQRVLHQFTDALQGIKQIVWSHADRWLLAVDEQERMFIYEAASGELVGFTDAHTLVGETLAWSPDGTQLAVGSTGDTVSIWDAEQSRPSFSLVDNGWVVTHIEWQADGSRIGVQTSETNWHSTTNAQIWEIDSASSRNVSAELAPLPDTPINLFDFSDDGSKLALVSGTHVGLYDVSGETAALILEDTLGYAPVSILLSTTGDGMIYRQDIFGAAPPYRTAEQQARFFLQLLPASDQTQVWSTASEQIVSMIWDIWDHAYIPEVNPWLRRSTDAENTLDMRLYGLQHIVTQGFTSPHGAFVAAIDENNTAMIWEAASGQPVAWIANAVQITWSPDETLIAVLSTDSSVWIMEADGTILTRLSSTPVMQTDVGAFYWSPNNQTLAHLRNGLIDVWDMSSLH